MPSEPRRYPWKTFFILTLAGTLTGPLIIPYLLGLEAAAPEALSRYPESIKRFVALVLVHNLVVLGIAAGLGLLIARKIGLGAPYLESRFDGAPRPAGPLVSVVRPAMVWATATALVAFGVDALFYYGLGVEFPAPEIHARIDVSWWRSGLASLSAPFSEEIIDRLFLLSLIAWLGMTLFRTGGSGRGRTIALWVANLTTVMIFGWQHLANEQLFADVVPTIVIARTMLIVAPVGLACGWLFWRHGLEAAILAHFVVDIIFHVIRPIVESWWS